MDYHNLNKLLREDVATVTFTKKDGTKRQMICTLLEQFLPEMNSTENKVPNTDSMTVWDLEQSAWRAFRMDSLISIETDTMLFNIESNSFTYV